jgi:hypothetical protein
VGVDAQMQECGGGATSAVSAARVEGIAMAERIEYLAPCHCGNLSARYRTALEPVSWSVRACQCSFCRSHGLLMTSDPTGEIEFRSTAIERVQRYRFGSRAAEVLLCRECGVVVGVQTDTPGRFAVLNVLALRPQLALPAAQPMEFGAESAAVRGARWAARWTPVAAGSL